MPSEDITVGQIVVSAAGRDIGKYYIVMEKLTPSFVLVANGRDRKAARPKKKNARHITILSSIAETLAEKLERREKISDEEIREALSQVCTMIPNVGSGEEERLRVQR